MMNERNFGEHWADLVYSGFLKIWQIVGHKWEIVEKPDAAALLIYHRDRRQVILIEQDRPAANGKIYEVPAGHIEAKPSNYDLLNWIRSEMAREAKEEVGADIDPDRILLVHNHGIFTSPGFTTEKIWLGYLVVEDKDIEQQERIFGLKEEGEKIKRHWLDIADLPILIHGICDMKSLVLLNWFLVNKYPQLKKGKR